MVDQLSARLTVGYWELDEAVQRLQDESKQTRQELRRAHKRLLEAEAGELAQAAIPCGSYRVARRVWGAEKPPGELRALAQTLIQRQSLVALLASVDDRVHLCFACAKDVDLDASELLQEACTRLGGKGGGQPHLAQGSAPVADEGRIEAILTELMSA